MTGVDVLTDGDGLFYSKQHPTRAVVELPFTGFALYEYTADNEGVHRGLGNHKAAYQWLSGEPPQQIEAWLVQDVSIGNYPFKTPRQDPTP
jgi:hypothetical protein